MRSKTYQLRIRIKTYYAMVKYGPIRLDTLKYDMIRYYYVTLRYNTMKRYGQICLNTVEYGYAAYQYGCKRSKTVKYEFSLSAFFMGLMVSSK